MKNRLNITSNLSNIKLLSKIDNCTGVILSYRLMIKPFGFQYISQLLRTKVQKIFCIPASF